MQDRQQRYQQQCSWGTPSHPSGQTTRARTPQLSNPEWAGARVRWEGGGLSPSLTHLHGRLSIPPPFHTSSERDGASSARLGPLEHLDAGCVAGHTNRALRCESPTTVYRRISALCFTQATMGCHGSLSVFGRGRCAGVLRIVSEGGRPLAAPAVQPVVQKLNLLAPGPCVARSPYTHDNVLHVP